MRINKTFKKENIPFSKIFDEVWENNAKNEIDIYRLASQYEGFKNAIVDNAVKLLKASYETIKCI